jgi:RND family efflux transporter MFP subunit
LKILRNILILGLVAAMVWGGFRFFQSAQDQDKKSKSSDYVASAERRDVEQTLLLTGEVVPAFIVDVKSEVGGKVKKLHAATGDILKFGDPIATIDDTDLLTEKAAAKTEIDGAQLTVDKNRGNYERAKALFDEKLISKEVFANLAADLAISENTLLKSRSRLQQVEDRLRKTRIEAPADGTVLDVLVNEGQVVVAAASVNAGTVLVNFADLSRLLINSHVNQVDAPMLKNGQEIHVNTASPEDKPIRARVEFIAPVATVKNNIKGFEVHALIEENDGRLKPGMSVSMHAPVQKASGAVTVPVAAIFKDQKRSVVYVRKGGHTEKRMVEVGITDLGFAEIRSGIEEGEEILLVEPEEPQSKS